MRIFQNAWFRRFARKERLSDDVLRCVITQAEQGLIDADLGGGVIKQRIARQGEGKSGGYRTIIIFRRGERAFFMYGFSKSKRENIDDDELKAFRKAASYYLGLGEDEIEHLLEIEL